MSNIFYRTIKCIKSPQIITTIKTNKLFSKGDLLAIKQSTKKMKAYSPDK